MPDPTVPVATDQTGVLDAGHTTTEYQQTRIVVVLTSLLAVLGTVSTLLDKALAIFPESSKGIGMWIAIGSVAIGGITTIAYTIQRSALKIAAIRAGETPPPDPATGDAAAARLGR